VPKLSQASIPAVRNASSALWSDSESKDMSVNTCMVRVEGMADPQISRGDVVERLVDGQVPQRQTMKYSMRLATTSPSHLQVSVSLFVPSRLRRLEGVRPNLALRIPSQLQRGIAVAMMILMNQYLASSLPIQALQARPMPSGNNVSRHVVVA
jgi:hypothetical protein